MSENELIWYYADQQAQLDRAPIGPVSLRDLDVLFRTGELNSTIYVWKEGMSEWEQLYKVKELKDTVLDGQEEMKTIEELYQKQQQELIQVEKAKLNKKKGKYQEKIEQKNDKANELIKEAEYNALMNKNPSLIDKTVEGEDNIQKQEVGIDKEDEGDDGDEDEDEKEYLKLLSENPEEAILQMANNTVKGFFYFSEEENKWHVCRDDPVTQEKIWSIQEEEPKEEMDAMREQLLSKLRVQFSSEAMADGNTVKDNVKEQVAAEGEQNDKDNFKGMTQEQIQKIKRNKKKTKRAALKKKEKWYQSKINTYIYVSGLPKGITVDVIDEFFSRAGVIRKDPVTGEKKIKLYKDENGQVKGDAVISYQMVESVEIAISMLDEREIEPHHKIKIEHANFQQSGENYKKREVEKKESGEKASDKVQQLWIKAEEKNQLGWEDEDQIDVGLKIVIIKNAYALEDINSSENFLEELKTDIATEIEKTVGQIQRMRLFEENPEGIIEIKFKDSQDAQYCIDLMHGRLFDGKKLECFFWDGQTDYKTAAKRINQSLDDDEEEEDTSRLEDFGKWIEEHNKQS